MTDDSPKRWHSRQRRPKDPPDPVDRKSAFDNMSRMLVSRYGDDIGVWLARRVATMFRRIDDPCVDNFRVCDAGDADERRQYEEARARGCCGAYEGTITHYASGRTFLFGCNYGH